MTLPGPDHPSLRFVAFETAFSSALGGLDSPDWLVALLSPDPVEPIDDVLRKAIRDMLRHHGYKPTGRGKPASEYLVRAAGACKLGTINLAVDACNATSLASGFPISVIDLDCATAPLRIDVGEAGARYVFNQGGQEIDVSGLLCVFDADGPCANGVKDSQRTKTSDATVRTLSVVWACAGFEEPLDAAVRAYREALERAGAVTSPS